MKRLIFFLGLSVLFSCSDNDDDITSNGNYFPAIEGSYWVYDVEANLSGKDSLYTVGTTEVGGETYTEFEARTPVFGLYTSLATQSNLKNEGGKLYVQGSFNSLPGLPVEVALELDDILLLDPGKSSGALLSDEDQEVIIPFGDYSILVNANIRTEMLENSSSLNVNGTNYSNVSSSVLSITASGAVTGTLDGVPITIPVIGEQEILRMELHFAEEIGLVYSEASLNMELSNLDVIELDLPENYSEEIIQALESYLIASP